MTYAFRLLAVTILALVIHLLLGWAWTVAAGVGAGLWIGRGGWLLGAASVGLEWLLVVLYNYAVDATAVHLMTETVGSIFGNLPFYLVVAFTVLIGILLGALGGAAGSQLHRIVRTTSQAAHT